jgi:PAS domain S-box-containing protein
VDLAAQTDACQVSRQQRSARVVVLVIVILVVTISHALYRLLQSQDVAYRSPLSTMWVTSQAEYELQRLLSALDVFAQPHSDMRGEVLLERYEIFWSQVLVLRQGRYAPSLTRDHDARRVIDGIITTLEELEPTVLRLAEGNREEYVELRMGLSMWVVPLHEMVVGTMQTEEARIYEEQQQIRTIHWALIANIVGIMLSGSLLILLLLRESRRASDLLRSVSFAERALRESEERFRDLVEGSVQGIAIDQDGRPLFANQSYANTFGYESPDEILALNTLDVLYAKTDAERIVDYRRSGGEPVPQTYELQGVCRNGTGIWLETRLRTISWQGLPAVQSIIIDITDRKRAEDERERLIEELETKNAELERFAYTVSHDLKSPLITIRAFADLAQQDAASGDIDSLNSDMSRIIDATDKMRQLLEQLLELSRIGRQLSPAEPIELAELAREAVELVSGRIREREIDVSVSEMLPVMLGDRARMLEVFQNLLENAAKFMGEEKSPRIEVGVRKDRGGTVCYVKDNGIGIEPRYQEKIFGLFDRLDAAGEGSGAGLALVKRIVELHGGEIWVESGGDVKGSTFCFSVPARNLV